MHNEIISITHTVITAGSWLLLRLLLTSTIFLIIILHHNHSSAGEKPATQG